VHGPRETVGLLLQSDAVHRRQPLAVDGQARIVVAPAGRSEQGADQPVGPQPRFADLVSGDAPGRTRDDQITWSERGNLQGAQFHAVAGKVDEAALAEGLGRELPDAWFLQTIRN